MRHRNEDDHLWASGCFLEKVPRVETGGDNLWTMALRMRICPQELALLSLRAKQKHCSRPLFLIWLWKWKLGQGEQAPQEDLRSMGVGIQGLGVAHQRGVSSYWEDDRGLLSLGPFLVLAGPSRSGGGRGRNEIPGSSYMSHLEVIHASKRVTLPKRASCPAARANCFSWSCWRPLQPCSALELAHPHQHSSREHPRPSWQANT